MSNEPPEKHSFWSSAITKAATFGRDTFVFSLIVISTFLALALKAPPGFTIATGFGLIAAYLIFRVTLLDTQLKERLFLIKTRTPELAELLIEEMATDAEKKLMKDYAEALDYQLSKGKKDGR